jgi:hypothetical protein
MKKNKNSKNSNIGRVYRQGDVLAMVVSEIPSGLKRTKQVVAAEGEITGHFHAMRDGAVGYAESEDGLALYAEIVSDQSSLTHDEHSAFTFTKGTKLKFIRQSEYQAKELKKVQD